MTKIKLCFSIFLILLLSTACDKDLDPMVQPVDFTVAVTYDEAYGNMAAVNIKVKATNVDNQLATEVVTDEHGMANFNRLPVGVYDITATVTYTPEQFQEFAGTFVSSEVVFNATITNQLINTNSSKEFVMELASARVGDLVIKQIYYAGSHRSDGAMFRDQFIEIYNNSSEVIYADGLYFAQLLGFNTYPIPSPAPAYLQASGQYDWSQAIGMPATINANRDFLYTKSLFQIPGSGTQYPIAPGESIVIAQNAINHKAPYQDQKGNTVTPKDPSLTVDLSQADFEAFYNKGFTSDLDNPAVENLIIHQPFGNDMLLDNLGRDSYIIFRSEKPVNALPKFPSPNKTEITATTDLYYQIPASLVIDAVETQDSPQALRPKKLSNPLDAGYTYVTLGAYSSQSVVREVAKTFNGRNILKDTNNSTNDFKVLDRANPGGF